MDHPADSSATRIGVVGAGVRVTRKALGLFCCRCRKRAMITINSKSWCARCFNADQKKGSQKGTAKKAKQLVRERVGAMMTKLKDRLPLELYEELRPIGEGTR